MAPAWTSVCGWAKTLLIARLLVEIADKGGRPDVSKRKLRRDLTKDVK